ncbi:hypothetical protein Aduo_000062 [Ancylostoma duodenale]
MSLNFVSVDPEFCGFCGAILQMPQTAPSSVACRVCGTQWHVREKRDHLVCRIEKIYERTVADTEGMEQDDGADAIVDHVCSKCGHGKASYSTMQTRSADEGQTVFYTCLKCKRKDIEYS